MIYKHCYFITTFKNFEYYVSWTQVKKWSALTILSNDNKTDHLDRQ